MVMATRVLLPRALLMQAVFHLQANEGSTNFITQRELPQGRKQDHGQSWL
jgi:hypothetical protein